MTTTAPRDPLEAIERALGALMQLAHLNHMHQWLCEQAGAPLDRPAYLALATLARDGSMRLSDLAEACDVGASTMSRLVDRLIEAGLLEADVSATDRRALILHVSDWGQKVIKRLQAARRTALAGFFAGWSEEDRQAFARLLARFTNEAEQRIKEDERCRKPLIK